MRAQERFVIVAEKSRTAMRGTRDWTGNASRSRATIHVLRRSDLAALRPPWLR